MPIQERRQHFRIEDQIYFDYKIIESDRIYPDNAIVEELLGQYGQRYMEAADYFQSIDDELTKLTEHLKLENNALAHYLNLMNAKIDFLAHHLLMGEKIQLKLVNISLGGMSFENKEKLSINSRLKMIIYTKPKFVPIIVTARVIYCEYEGSSFYRTAVKFESLTAEQEKLLSQHIMLAQVHCKSA